MIWTRYKVMNGFNLVRQYEDLSFTHVNNVIIAESLTRWFLNPNLKSDGYRNVPFAWLGAAKESWKFGNRKI